MHGRRNPERSKFNNAIWDEVRDFCHACDVPSRMRREQDVGSAESQRRNDVEIDGQNTGGGPLWLDIVAAVAAAHVEGVTAKKAEDEKLEKYSDLVQTTESRPTFVPLAWETGGR